jgi:hypothetical protein
MEEEVLQNNLEWQREINNWRRTCDTRVRPEEGKIIWETADAKLLQASLERVRFLEKRFLGEVIGCTYPDAV